MTDNRPGIADYMLAVMDQILGSAAVEKEVSETENKGKIVADDTLKNLKAPKSSDSITVEFGLGGNFSGNFEEMIKAFAEKEGLSVLSVTKSKGNLENIFRELTQK